MRSPGGAGKERERERARPEPAIGRAGHGIDRDSVAPRAVARVRAAGREESGAVERGEAQRAGRVGGGREELPEGVFEKTRFAAGQRHEDGREGPARRRA